MSKPMPEKCDVLSLKAFPALALYSPSIAGIDAVSGLTLSPNATLLNSHPWIRTI